MFLFDAPKNSLSIEIFTIDSALDSFGVSS